MCFYYKGFLHKRDPRKKGSEIQILMFQMKCEPAIPSYEKQGNPFLRTTFSAHATCR